jgi:hypothetical protein
MLKAKCPACGCDLEVYVDLSEGPPDEVGAECLNCGAIPVWRLNWWYEVEIGDFAYYEREASPALKEELKAAFDELEDAGVFRSVWHERLP